MKRTSAGCWLIVCAAVCLSGLTALGQVPPLAWPNGFAGSGDAETKWLEHVLDSPLVSTRVALPAHWTVSRQGSGGDLAALDLKCGCRVEIAEAKPSPFNYTEPVSAERLKGSIATMQSSAPAGYIVEKAGQVRAGQQLWLWHQSRIPSFDGSVPPEYQEMLRSVPYGSGRTWSFVTTPHAQLVRIYFSVLYPRNASETEVAAIDRKAGVTFVNIVERVSFRAK